jgi:tRNA(Ile)-lysidine synthase
VRAEVLRVQVGSTGGPEAAARTARYAALDAARAGAPVLIGHTLDDQAETVLLGLGRGSGARSIAGMRAADPPWYRPLLGVRRSVTRAACTELGLVAWDDPHNSDPRFTRVRLSAEVLPLLEQVLGGGVAEALARTAAALREDNDALDCLAARNMAAGPSGGGLDVDAIRDLPDALRRRVIRAWLLGGGAIGLTDTQIRAVDALVSSWRGQGGVAVSSDVPRTRLFAERHGGTLTLLRKPL